MTAASRRHGGPGEARYIFIADSGAAALVGPMA